ncbi:MAG TPA: hypothetical protein VHE61_04325 [Opitutaceae bacterium]|nr:hypothetical protein [Opitutaceae bacterium]
MNKYYARTILGMAVVFGSLAIAAVLANSAAAEARARYADLLSSARRAEMEAHDERNRFEQVELAMAPVRQFAEQWSEFARLPEKDAAERIRSDIEAIAQRQLALVTDNAITPQPDRYGFQATTLRVQRVTLRASGKDLASLLAWLGRLEEKYPAALIELAEFSSNIGGNTGLTIRLVQPLRINSAHRAPAPAVRTVLDSIASTRWEHYLPERVKRAVAVGFQRNPLQPAVTGEQQAMSLVRDEADEIHPRIRSALDGRVRTVIRGATSIVVIDGRVFRVGDELVLGSGRERPIPAAVTKLKEIGDDRLVFSVAGGTLERPVQCSVEYLLPAFLNRR